MPSGNLFHTLNTCGDGDVSGAERLILLAFAGSLVQNGVVILLM